MREAKPKRSKLSLQIHLFEIGGLLGFKEGKNKLQAYHGSGGTSNELNWGPDVPVQACSARIKRKRSSKRSSATPSLTFSVSNVVGTLSFTCKNSQNN